MGRQWRERKNPRQSERITKSSQVYRWGSKLRELEKTLDRWRLRTLGSEQKERKMQNRKLIKGKCRRGFNTEETKKLKFQTKELAEKSSFNFTIVNRVSG